MNTTILKNASVPLGEKDISCNKKAKNGFNFLCLTNRPSGKFAYLVETTLFSKRVVFYISILAINEEGYEKI